MTSPRLCQTRPPLCPVTALAFYQHGPRRLVLAGEGGWLAIYETGTAEEEEEEEEQSRRRCLGRIRIFAEQAIQGLRVGKATDDSGSCASASASILAWGGSSVALVTREHIARALLEEDAAAAAAAAPVTVTVTVDEVAAPDWIYDGLLPQCAGGLGALVTAHNEVIPFRVDADDADDTAATSDPRITLLGPPISPSRPMLYSAQLAWASGSSSSEEEVVSRRRRLLVAAGTVFGEIVVWTCQLTTPAEPRIKVHQVFTGHEGSIFDVVVSDEMDLAPLPHMAPRRARLLASCSDDRTIRIWPLYLGSDDDDDTNENKEVAATNEARETGFQNTFEGLAHRSSDDRRAAGDSLLPTTRHAARTKHTAYLQSDDLAPPPSSPASAAAPPIATVMAHASRIWHVRFGALDGHGAIPVYSFGEDACAQEWRLEMRRAGEDLAAELVHLRTLSLHAGKNIWSAAVSVSVPAAGPPLVATGGSDGKICLFAGRPTTRSVAAAADDGHQAAGPERSTEVIVRSTVPPASPTPAEPAAEPEIISSQQSADDDDDLDAMAAKKKKKKKPSQKKAREEVFNSYAFLSDSQLLAATNHGRLLLGEFRESAQGLLNTTSSSMQWTALRDIPPSVTQSLVDYNIVRSPRGGGGGGMATVPGVEGLAFLGTATGQLSFYSAASGKVHELATKLPGKVDDIFFLPPTASASDNKNNKKNEDATVAIELVATTLFRDEAVLLDITIDTAAGTLLSCRSERTLRLPKKAPTSPTAMTITAASRCLDYIVLGSRNGQLCLYRPTTGDAAAGDFVLETQLQTRTKDAVLSIVPLPPRPGHAPLSSSSFVVTARDGTYRIYAIESTAAAVGGEASTQIALKHETATPFGPIVRDAWFVDSATAGEPPELVVCGFRSTNFVVWNETRQQELATVDCGGTHRTHTYLYCNGGGNGGAAASETIRFAFTRNAELHLFAQNACATSPLKQGGHGREIRAVSASASGRYVATGAEDTVVRIWSRSRSRSSAAADSNWRCLSVLKLHNTGLHNIVWLGDSCLISAAGSEELFIWRITTICDSAYDGLAVLCESSYPDSTNDKVLRIIGLDATLEDNEKMLISMGISNSTIKTYRYTPSPVPGRSSGTWQLLAQGHYTGACPTQVRHLPTMGPNRGLAVLTAFADGHLVIWTAVPDAPATAMATQPGEYALVCATRAHQNAVKALDVLPRLPTASTLGLSRDVIFTGGDDNSIAVTTLNWADGDNTGPPCTFGTTFRVSRAHAASINGAKILESATSGDTDRLAYSSFTAVTCSNDQRVKAWRVLMAAPGSEGARAAPPVRIQLLSNCYSAIADSGDIECIDGNSRGAIVVGMGMETWSLQ